MQSLSLRRKTRIMNNINIAIFGANLYNGNRGVGALAYSTLAILDEVFQDTQLKPIYYMLSIDYKGKRTDSVKIGEYNVDIINIDPINIYDVKSFVKFLLDRQQVSSVLKYPKFDLIFNVGGGDSFADIYGVDRFKSINIQNTIARLLGKRYVILPQTIGPFKNSKIHKQAVKSINKAEYVFARDETSYSFIKENTKQKACSESVDMAFFMPFKTVNFSDDFINVGLNISSLLWYGGYTQDNQFNLKLDYKELSREIIGFFLAQPNVKLHLVPHVVHEYSHIENDYEISNTLVEEYANDQLVLSPFFLDPIAAKGYISGLDFFTGARMHATIAAFSSKVPVFPLAYSRKFNGLYKQTLKYANMGDMVAEEASTIMQNLVAAFENREVLKSEIAKTMDVLIQQRRVELKAVLLNIVKE